MVSRKPKTVTAPTGRAEKRRIKVLKAATRCFRKTETEWIDGLTDLLRTDQARGHGDPTLDARDTALLLTAIWDGTIIQQAYSAGDTPQVLLAFFDTTPRRLLAREGKADKRVRTAVQQKDDPECDEARDP